MSSGDAVGELLAKQEIRDVLALYCRAIDRLDAEQLADVYHPDALDEHGQADDDRSAARFQAAVLGYLRASCVSTQHVLGSIHIDVSGDVARSEAYVTAYHVGAADPSGMARMTVIGARYVDRFERREGRWRIARRLAVRDWQETRTFVPASVPTGTVGVRDRSDAVYDR